MTKKDETYWKVLNSALSLDFKKGHQRWTMSDLSRASGVTRSLIYYYFGRSKDEILLEAVKLIGEEVMGLSEERRKLWEAGDIVSSVIKSRDMISKSPHLAPFYMAHRVRETNIGEALRRLERDYIKKLKTFFPGASDNVVHGQFGLFFGLVFAPLMTESSIRAATEVGAQQGKKAAT